MKGLKVSRSIWKLQTKLKTTGWTRQLAIQCKLLRGIKKNICWVENIMAQELNQTDYVLDYRIH